MVEPDWHDPRRELPPDGAVVLTMNSRGQVQTLVYERNLWWFPDRSMYVYYEPTFWRQLSPRTKAAAREER